MSTTIPMLKYIRIRGTTGKVVISDRKTNATKAAANGGPDRIMWTIVGPGGPFRVHFAKSPFLAGAGPEDITVPQSSSRTVAAPLADYKYSVYRGVTKTDDPNVIIDS